MPGLDLLVVWATTRCQLSCRYCYMSAGDGPGHDLDPTQFVAALKAVRLRPGATVQIAGGEPGLVPKVVDAVAEAAWAAGAGRVAIQTNGLEIDDGFVALVRKRRLGVGVSLDGPPEINDAQRGRTADVLRGMRALDDAGVPFGVTTVLTRESLPGLFRLALVLAGFPQARSIGLDVLRPAGRGTGLDLPTPAEVSAAFTELSRVLGWVNARRARPLHLREAATVACGERRAYCPAEEGRSAVLTPDGGLWPCASLVGLAGHSCGDVAAPDLARLGRGLKVDESACARCALPGCRGRCPARATLSPRAAALDCAMRRAAWGLKAGEQAHAAE
jgi:uncharacterized protein